MSPRRNWDSPNPSLASECDPPPRTGGGGGWGAHTPAGEALGQSQFRRLEKKLSTLPNLCKGPTSEYIWKHIKACSRSSHTVLPTKVKIKGLMKGYFLLSNEQSRQKRLSWSSCIFFCSHPRPPLIGLQSINHLISVKWQLADWTKNVSYIDFWPGMTFCLCGW